MSRAILPGDIELEPVDAYTQIPLLLVVGFRPMPFQLYPPGAVPSDQAYTVATSGNVNDLRRRIVDFLSNISPRTGSLPDLSPARYY